MVYNIEQIIKDAKENNGICSCHAGITRPDGKKIWVAARPLDYRSFIGRLREAWGVLTGKYDALKWEGQ